MLLSAVPSAFHDGNGILYCRLLNYIQTALCNVNTKHGYRSKLPGDVEDFGSQHLPDLTSTRRTPWSQTRRKTRNDGETLSLRAVTFNVATDAWLDGCEPKVAAPKRRRSRSHRDD
ncbi:hypothetical protein CCHR01_18148 [Colletotrichum chrysophilum]|uniref:Uncharacterized protein n=1 Tax=Colletotrichum chrysophilum TaxID=1836956 RepID=A0AAD9A0M8_9PEZI|nr:hypothetical protein CCHR01_18148 [Colletotrichum chrysophilum]